MVSIPDRLRALITFRPTKTEGRLQIELPKELVEHAAVDPGEVYQVAVLPAETRDASDNGRDTPPSSDSSASSTATISGPPVEEGEVRTVTIDTLGDQGDGITRVERGFVLIVPEAEPDEKVTVEIDTVQSNVAFASIVEREEEQ
jgi:predicted RNA-binding protein with TRAM domain